LRKKSFFSRYPPLKHRVVWSFPLFILPSSTLLIMIAARNENWFYGGVFLAVVSGIIRAAGIHWHEN